MNEPIICFDCKKELSEGEDFIAYKTEEGEFYKCKACHLKDSTLRNYRPVERYSRVCGYMRPVEQWNPGKQEEFKDRVNFKIK
jgi:ribonucleoside-triphosphate reductase